MKISFTVCSANYLPYAKSVGDSLIRFNPDHQFIIVLLDRRPEKDLLFFAPHQIIAAEDMQLPYLAEMNERYTIFELSCALKPFAADHIFTNFSACDELYYFDSDILVYGKMHAASKLLNDHPLVLTPHLATAKQFEGRAQADLDNLHTGIYNAGFFGLRRHEESHKFLQWWMERMRLYCYNDAVHGLFVDQLWLSLAPNIFTHTAILREEGYNMAYWNFAERSLRMHNDSYLVNDQPLVFFHFSGYDIEQANILSKHAAKFTFENSPEFIPLFNDYRNAAIANNRDDYFTLLPFFGKKPAPLVPATGPAPREKNFFKRKSRKWFGKI